MYFPIRFTRSKNDVILQKLQALLLMQRHNPCCYDDDTLESVTCINSIREKNNVYFSGATFQACLHENNTLKFVLHWTLCKFTGALFWLSGALLGVSGAISPRALRVFFSLNSINQFCQLKTDPSGLCIFPKMLMVLHASHPQIYTFLDNVDQENDTKITNITHEDTFNKQNIRS